MRENIIDVCYFMIIDQFEMETTEREKAAEYIEDDEAEVFAEYYVECAQGEIGDICSDYTDEMEIMPIIAEFLKEMGCGEQMYHKCMTSEQYRRDYLAAAIQGELIAKFTKYLEEEFEL